MFSNQVFYEPEKFDCAYTKIKETIPQSRLGYHLNNKYDGFPALMSDGRAVTAAWQPEAVLNDNLVKELGITTNWQYRQYMIQNAKNIMKYNCVQASTDSGYLKKYSAMYDSANYSTPHTFSSFTDSAKPQGYEGSDLKELYLTREQLQSRMVSPELSQADILKMKQQSNLKH